MTDTVPRSEMLERELKFDADVEFILPDLEVNGGSISRQPELRLRTAYFDTADLRLWTRGISFRHRTSETQGTSTWTVKLPAHAEGPTLDRTELSWSGIRESVPSEALKLLRGIIRTSSLNQIVELVTARLPLVLNDSDGERRGEIDDDTVTIFGAGRSGVRFRQIELELEARGDSLVGPVSAQLIRAGASPGGGQKLAKALDGSSFVPRDAASPAHRGSSIGDLVEASLVAALDRLLVNDYAMRLDPSDPSVEAVHRARVATRRLRSELKLFSAAVDPVWLTDVRLDLRWLGDVLGRVRDSDVLATVLRGDRDASFETEGFAELRSKLHEQRQAHCRVLAEALDSTRYLTLLDQLEAAIQMHSFSTASQKGPGSTHPRVADQLARKQMPKLVRKRWQGLQREARKAGRQPVDVALHQMRIRSKELRYVAEAAIPVIGKDARRTALAAEQAQSVLGEHHDAVNAERWLRDQAMEGPFAASYVAGRLAAEAARTRNDLRQTWASVWRQLNRKRFHRWF